MNSDTVTATEVRASVEEIFVELEGVGKRLDRMTRTIYHAGREVGSEMVKSALADEARSVARLSDALAKCWTLLDSIDEDLAKLEREGRRGKGYAMPPSPHPIENVSFMKASPAPRREVRPGSVPFGRRAATEAVGAYSDAIGRALRATAASVAAYVRKANMDKAAGDDNGDADGILDASPLLLLPAAAAAIIAARIARSIDLSGLNALAALTTPAELVASTVSEALDLLDMDVPPDVQEQIQAAAAKRATGRAAELVGLRQEHGGPVGDPGAQREIITPTRDAVRSVIERHLQNGSTRDAIADAILDLDAFSQDRAELIATNELRDVNEVSQLLAWQGASAATGVEIRKRWVTDPGSKLVCDVCIDNEAQGPIALDEQFQSGDDCPPNHPRCRCHVEPVIASSKAFNPQKRTLH
jgi:hypothetical protein